MQNDSHISTSPQLAGTAGTMSYPAGYRRTYAWRFI
jgi:hypothetical protein